MPQATPLRAAVVGSTGYIGMQCTALLAGAPERRARRRARPQQRGQAILATSCPGAPSSWPSRTASTPVRRMSSSPRCRTPSPRAWRQGGSPAGCNRHRLLRRLPPRAMRLRTSSGTASNTRRRICSMRPSTRWSSCSASGWPRANLISVPGCYPTATLLACVPALRAGLVERDIVVDAKSGVSGAGREAKLGNSFSEVNESVHAYGVEGHRHKSEMLEQLRDASGADVRLTFVPHLIPMTRGILATAYLHPLPGVTARAAARRSTRTSVPPARFSTSWRARRRPRASPVPTARRSMSAGRTASR